MATCQPQEGFPIVGSVSDHAFELDANSRQVEERLLLEGSILYHYFEGDRSDDSGIPFWRVVMTKGAVASKVRCMSRGAILRSIGTGDPHYGDGTYFSLNWALKDACDEVKRAHGIHIPSRNFRAVFSVRRPDLLRKFERTGGVGRSIPTEGLLNTDGLVFLGGARR